jgi:excisionase family DNA binding protein
MIERRWLIVGQVAADLGAHKKTVYSWVGRGMLPAVRVGGSVRIDKKQLDEDLARQIANRDRRAAR